jgi:hypothetical protein
VMRIQLLNACGWQVRQGAGLVGNRHRVCCTGTAHLCGWSAQLSLVVQCPDTCLLVQ